MGNTLTVLAAKGLKCPMERQPRKYITDTPPKVTTEGESTTGYVIADTQYYRRLINDGSLVLVSEQKEASAPAAASAKPAQAAPRTPAAHTQSEAEESNGKEPAAEGKK